MAELDGTPEVGEAAAAPLVSEEWLHWGSTLQRGRCEIECARSLSKLTTLRIGGLAEVYAEPWDADGLRALQERCRSLGAAVHPIGQGSNLLVPDEGLRGVVLRLRGDFRQVEINGTRVRAGGAVVVPQLARKTVRQGLLGLEALGGFPASVGGAVTMNAGCYGTEVIELLEEIEVLLPSGAIEILRPLDLEAGYRRTNLRQRGAIVLAATFRLSSGDAERGERRLEELNKRRWDSLPSGKPNAGSTFQNPEQAPAGRLLEEAGLKGFRIGGAAFSEKHANVVVNLGGALAVQVVDVMREGRRRVAEQTGVHLEPELLLLGDLRRRFEASPQAPGSASEGVP